MPDCESTLKGLSEVSEYLLAKTDIAGAGKGKEVFGFWYRSVEDALALLKEQEPVKPKEYMSRVNRTEYLCGACDSGILYGDEFCRHCGRQVMWDD